MLYRRPVDIETKVAFLQQAVVYPDQPRQIEVIETQPSASHLEDHLPQGAATKWIIKTRGYLDLASVYIEQLV